MKKRIAILLSLIMLLSMISMGTAYGDINSPYIYRLGGNNRYETAIKIAEDGWESASSVVLANGDDFADALAGVPLASALDAPILVTKANKIDNEVLKTIKKLGAEKVYILGGSGAISVEAEKQLKGYEIIRLGGDTRFETSVKIAEELAQVTGIESQYIFVAYAYNYPDALSISSVAGCMECPIIYAPQKGTIDKKTEEFIGSAYREKAVVLGGPAVINNSVLNSIKKAGVKNVSRLYGNNRYETCVKIYEEYGFMFDFSSIAVATGEAFPDGLAGGVYAAKKWMPVILVSNTQKQAVVKDFIRSISPGLVYAFGGQGAVSDATIYNLYKLYEDTDTGVILYHDNNLPEEFAYGWRGVTYTKMLIKEIQYTVESYEWSGKYGLKMKIFAEKTYNNPQYSSEPSKCWARYTVRDESGFLVDSGVIISTDAYTGDSFAIDLNVYDLKPGAYTIEFSDYNNHQDNEDNEKYEPIIEKCVVSNCNKVRNSNSQYCFDHNCIVSGCNNFKESGEFYCTVHKCGFTGCTLRKDGDSRYCKFHHCQEPYCGNLRENDFFCSIHKRCAISSCNQMRDGSQRYCREHVMLMAK